MMFSKLRLAVLTTLVAIPGLAAAQSAPSQSQPERVGFEIGLGLYGGEINCDNEEGNSLCDGVTEAAGIDVHANYFFTPTVGIFADVWPMVHTEDDWSFTHNIVTIGAKVRPVPILTLAAGIGSAQASVSYDVGPFEGESQSDVVGAIFFSAGVDVVRGSSFAINLEARAGIGFYGDDNDNNMADITGRNLGLGAAVTWF